MISVKGVTKEYGKKDKVRILDRVSFEAADGEIIALLGHNGSGKSTLIKCITGTLKPDCGSVTIDGRDSFKARRQLCRNMGVVFNQKPSFIVDLPVRENLLFFKAIYGLSDAEYEERRRLINQFLDIDDLYEKPYRKLSFGERVKCEITSVLLHSPHYVLLDEPTIGLDYNAKRGLYELLAYLKRHDGITAVIATHEVDYIQGICDRAVIMNKGRVHYSGTPGVICDLLAKTASVKVCYTAILDEKAACELLKEADSHDKDEMTFTKSFFEAADKDAFLLAAAGAFSIGSVSTQNASLREVFERVLKEIDAIS